jgi:hypothetical protein
MVNYSVNQLHLNVVFFFFSVNHLLMRENERKSDRKFSVNQLHVVFCNVKVFKIFCKPS